MNVGVVHSFCKNFHKHSKLGPRKCMAMCVYMYMCVCACVCVHVCVCRVCVHVCVVIKSCCSQNADHLQFACVV